MDPHYPSNHALGACWGEEWLTQDVLVLSNTVTILIETHSEKKHFKVVPQCLG